MMGKKKAPKPKTCASPKPEQPRRSGRIHLPRLSSNQHAVYVDDGEGNLKLAGIETYDGQSVPVPDENTTVYDPVVEKPKTAKKNTSTTAKKSKGVASTPATVFKVPKAKPQKNGTTTKKTAVKTTARPESRRKADKNTTVILSKNSRPVTRHKTNADSENANSEKVTKKTTLGTAAKETPAGSNPQTGTAAKRGRPKKILQAVVVEKAAQTAPKEIVSAAENVPISEPHGTAAKEPADASRGHMTATKRGRPPKKGTVTAVRKADNTAPKTVSSITENMPDNNHSVQESVVEARLDHNSERVKKMQKTGEADPAMTGTENLPEPSEQQQMEDEDGPRGWETKKPSAKNKRGPEEMTAEGHKKADLPVTSLPENAVHSTGNEAGSDYAMASIPEPRPAKLLARTALRTMLKDKSRSRIVKKKSGDAEKEPLVADSIPHPASLETLPSTSTVTAELPKLNKKVMEQAPHRETQAHIIKQIRKPEVFHMRKRQKISPERFVENDNEGIDLASVSFAYGDDAVEGYKNAMGTNASESEPVRYSKLIKMPAAESGRFRIKAGMRKGGSLCSRDVTLMMFVHAGRARIHRSEELGEHSYFTVQVGGVASVAPGRWYDVEARGSDDLDLFFVRVYNRSI